MVSKVCGRCGRNYNVRNFLPAKSKFLPDSYSPFCKRCAATTIETFPNEWTGIDRLCQLLNYPFIPSIWEKNEIEDIEQKLSVYFSFFAENEEYSELDWDKYYKAFLQLRESGELEQEIPLVSEKKKRELVARWGADSELTEDDYNYLQNLYEGILSGQPMTSALIEDNVRKICHTLLLIDRKIRGGDDYDKLLKSYDSLMKLSGLTAKESKESGEIETIGELAAYLEKKNWLSTRHEEDHDIVDLTMREIQNNNQRLYTNEPGIGDEITARIENLKSALSLELSANTDEPEGKLVPGYQDIDSDFQDPYLLEEEDFIEEEE